MKALRKAVEVRLEGIQGSNLNLVGKDASFMLLVLAGDFPGFSSYKELS